MPDAQGNLTKDERTTPLGLYHYAVSYEAAARVLMAGLTRDMATHPSAPTNHLLEHSIELYLKAFLRLNGVSLERLKNEFGHAIPKLFLEFIKLGGPSTDHDVGVTSFLTPAYIFAERYIVVGAYPDIGTDNIAKTAANLHAVVRDAIRASGEYCSD